jgi:hypothetical protein
MKPSWWVIMSSEADGSNDNNHWIPARQSRLTLRAGLPHSFAPEDSKEMLFSADPREED